MAARDEPRRCRGTNVDGSPCRVSSELLIQDEDGGWWCFGHHPHKAVERSLAGSLGNAKSNAKRRKGIDVGALETAADARRICGRLVVAIAAGELPADQGRTALAALREWRLAFEAAELEEQLHAMEAEVARLKGGH